MDKLSKSDHSDPHFDGLLGYVTGGYLTFVSRWDVGCALLRTKRKQRWIWNGQSRLGNCRWILNDSDILWITHARHQKATNAIPPVSARRGWARHQTRWNVKSIEQLCPILRVKSRVLQWLNCLKFCAITLHSHLRGILDAQPGSPDKLER